MDFSENYDELLKNMDVNFETPNLSHKIDRKSPLLPFKIKNVFPKFEKGFYNILGEFSRILLDQELNNDFSLQNLIPNNINNEDIISIEEGNEEHLTQLLNEYIFDGDDLKILHPHLYLYVPLSNNNQKSGERELALFLRDIFCSGNESLIDFFNSNKSSYVLLDLVLENAPDLDNDPTERKYFSKLNYVSDLFKEDIEFAVKNEKFFIDNMDNIFAFYYFFYISQLILKLAERLNYDEGIEKLYYLLEWENIIKSRKTVDKDYDFFKDVCYATYPRACLISQLNTLMGTENEYYLEHELLEYFNGLDYDSQQNFLGFLKKWILDYHFIQGFEETDKIKNLPNDYKELVDILYSLLDDDEKGVSYGSKQLFVQNFEAIAKKYFFKFRGSKGYILNINRDMLLMITKLCVKDKKITTKQLFKEYKKRGVFFDSRSEGEVINFLTRLNLIDKKSDSGEDAQYVKPIL